MWDVISEKGTPTGITGKRLTGRTTFQVPRMAGRETSLVDPSIRQNRALFFLPGSLFNFMSWQGQFSGPESSDSFSISLNFEDERKARED
jgi:hypothetical protein